MKKGKPSSTSGFLPQKSINILAIGAHPDDIEIGCGATLAKASRLGHNVFMQILTDGAFSGDPRTRRSESERAAKKIGARDLLWGGFQDTRLPFYDNLIPKIEEAIAKTDPAFVFIHHGHDTHQDHRSANAASIVAARRVRNVMFFESPTTIDFSPNVYVDVGDSLNKKIESLQAHASQVMKTNIQDRSIMEMAKALATFRGTQARVKSAEAFSALRMFILV